MTHDNVTSGGTKRSEKTVSSDVSKKSRKRQADRGDNSSVTGAKKKRKKVSIDPALVIESSDVSDIDSVEEKATGPSESESNTVKEAKTEVKTEVVQPSDAIDLALEELDRKKLAVMKSKSNRGTARKHMHGIEVDGHRLVIDHMWKRKNKGTLELLRLLNQSVEEKARAFHSYSEAIEAKKTNKTKKTTSSSAGKRKQKRQQPRSKKNKTRSDDSQPDVRNRKGRKTYKISKKKLKKDNMSDSTDDDSEPLVKSYARRKQKMMIDEEEGGHSDLHRSGSSYNSCSEDEQESYDEETSENIFLAQVATALGWASCTYASTAPDKIDKSIVREFILFRTGELIDDLHIVRVKKLVRHKTFNVQVVHMIGESKNKVQSIKLDLNMYSVQVQKQSQWVILKQQDH